jgi:serine/threonine-protein kinase
MALRRRFGKYQIIKKIADGGMATIYLASSAGPDGFSKLCALKLIRPEFSARPEVVRMLVQEAKVAGLLSHPNIVQVFDFGKIENEYFLTMEWIDGASLGELIAGSIERQQPLSVGVVTHIALAIAQALAYLRTGITLDGAHVNLVHRDVTPSNVLISGSGVVKLTDFGIVKVLEAPTSTNIGVVKGKYAYMSPEQLRGDPIDHRSDIFALGVILYELITRRRLFRRKTLAATIAAVHAARVAPPSELAPGTPKELDAIILRALAKKPDDRYQSAQDLADDLWPLYSANSRGATGELVRLIETTARQATLDEATAPALSSAEPPEGDAGLEVEFDALEDVEEPHAAASPDGPPTWSENESLPEAAFESTATRIRPQHTDEKRRENMVTFGAIGAGLVATIVFWMWVLS